MKRIIFFLLMAVLLLAGCKETEEKTETITETITEPPHYALVYGSLDERGFLYVKNEQIHFVDKNNVETLVCSQPNCTHASEECGAVLPIGKYSKASMYGDHIYIYTKEGLFEHSVYETDLDGSNRRKIAQIPFSFYIKYFVYRAEYVYYIGIETVANEDGSYNSYYNIIELNLETGDYRVIVEPDYDKNYEFFSMYFHENDIYYMYREIVGEANTVEDYRNNMKESVYRVDLDTLEKTLYIDADDYPYNSFRGLYKDYAVICNKIEYNDIRLRNLKTGKEETVVKTEDAYIISINWQGRYVIYLTANKTNPELRESYIYDIESGEIHENENFGEKGILMADSESGLAVFSGTSGEYEVGRINTWEEPKE